MLPALLYKCNRKGLGWFCGLFLFFFFLNTKTANEYMKKKLHTMYSIYNL